MGNVVFTLCILIKFYDDLKISKYSRQDLITMVQPAIRYMTSSHMTGERACANGKKWGLVWQSSWWTTRMAVGAFLIWNNLPDELQSSIIRVVESEANRQLGRIVPTGLFEDTKAEENAWDAEILGTAISLMSSHQNNDKWHIKLKEFAVNTFSIAEDRKADKLIDEIALKEQVYTCNVHSDFTIENHGAYHFCYVASPLHSICWTYSILKMSGSKIPESLFHHYVDVWKRAKMTFLENRFAYVSGQDWARYAYGQYFIIPPLILLQCLFQDTDASFIEHKIVSLFYAEHKNNNDGSFFGERFTKQSYYGQTAKYETDCFACVGLGYLLKKNLKHDIEPLDEKQFNVNNEGRHISPEASICFERNRKHFFSFSWKTLQTDHPNAVFVPTNRDDMAEWMSSNLLGKIVLLKKTYSVGILGMKECDNGIKIEGQSICRDANGAGLYESFVRLDLNSDLSRLRIKIKTVTKADIFIHKVIGINLAISNDIFNGCRRNYHSEKGVSIIEFDPKIRGVASGKSTYKRLIAKIIKFLGKNAIVHEIEGTWVNLDNSLGIALHNGKNFNLIREYGRNSTNQSLHYDVITSPYRILNKIVKGETILLDQEYSLHIGNAEQSKRLSDEIRNLKNQNNENQIKNYSEL